MAKKTKKTIDEIRNCDELFLTVSECAKVMRWSATKAYEVIVPENPDFHVTRNKDTIRVSKKSFFEYVDRITGVETWPTC